MRPGEARARRARRRLQSDRVRTAFTSVDGLRIRYAASDRDAAETILLTSPWPESVDAFAPIWPLLSCRFRLLAVDLPGLGGSERRDGLLPPRALGDFLVRVIDERRLDCPHVVGPGIGTSAALFAAAARPDLVSTVIVGSDVRRCPAALGELAERLPGIDAPVQI